VNRLKLLVIYSASEYPVRKTVWSYLYCFKKRSSLQVYYWNYFWWRRFPFFLNLAKVDVVLFHHSVTTPWTRSRYLRKIEFFKRVLATKALKVALFQDEYFNCDLSCEFVNALGISHVFSVAPEVTWPVIYRSVDPKKTKIHRILTGYINQAEIPATFDSGPRPIDVGYRTDWTNALYKTGSFGLRKKEIAEKFLPRLTQSGFSADIRVNRRSFLTGNRWFEFLKRCRFVLGVESGSGVVDTDGSILTCIAENLRRQPSASFETIKRTCFPNQDGKTVVRALSPRHFEAILCGACQILMEGEYNGILIPWRHYLPLKSDYSNIDGILERLRDEKKRLAMAEQAFSDIVLSGKYSYDAFVSHLLSIIQRDIPVATPSRWPFKLPHQVFNLLDTMGWAFGAWYRLLAFGKYFS